MNTKLFVLARAARPHRRATSPSRRLLTTPAVDLGAGQAACTGSSFAPVNRAEYNTTANARETPRRLSTLWGCMSHPRSTPGISMIEVVDLCWRLSPEPTVEHQQADSEQAPDQRVEPKHPGCVGTGRPQGAGLNGAIGRVCDQGEQRAARGVVEQPGVPERNGGGLCRASAISPLRCFVAGSDR